MVDAQKYEQYERELGGINAKLDYIKTSMDKTDANFNRVFARLDNIDANGCARGLRNSKDIEALQRKPGQTVTVLAAILSSLAAVGAWLSKQ